VRQLPDQIATLTNVRSLTARLFTRDRAWFDGQRGSSRGAIG
jgi:hypothetical protein